ncbi:hypothetical protein [Burkholderia sp. TSV86]|uniref:hypothetical protein n=1 Tax=Burkholderia sp. TSV86 TaxID=1385594 RepID=UPI0018D236F4|nr:hypothetical protein [Burkholderia sp. TSV86]
MAIERNHGALDEKSHSPRTIPMPYQLDKIGAARRARHRPPADRDGKRLHNSTLLNNLAKLRAFIAKLHLTGLHMLAIDRPLPAADALAVTTARDASAVTASLLSRVIPRNPCRRSMDLNRQAANAVVHATVATRSSSKPHCIASSTSGLSPHSGKRECGPWSEWLGNDCRAAKPRHEN